MADMFFIMKYKGYEGTVKLDEEAGIFHGEVIKMTNEGILI